MIRDPGAKLKLYLVEEGLKPASLIDFDSKAMYQNRGKGTIAYQDRGSEPLYIYNPDHEEVRAIIDDVKSRGVPFTYEFDTCYHSENEMAYTLAFKVAKDKERLSDLERALAMSQKDSREYHENLGRALGFPQLDIEEFAEGRSNLSYFVHYLRENGLETPEWLPYIDFVPSVVGGKISEEAKEMGIRNRNHVRNNNPGLFEEIETYQRPKIERFYSLIE